MSDFERIAYQDGATALTGLLVRPEVKPRAAILVFPTIANVTPPIERRARMLAKAGYIALIADLYGFAPTAGEEVDSAARALRQDVDGYRARVRAALTALEAVPGVEHLRIAGVVSFHGILQTARPASRGQIKAHLLICHGDADPLVPRDEVRAFWERMDEADATWHFHSYSGTKHGFTDPGSDARGINAIAYNPSADRQSWAAMLSFFDELFERKPDGSAHGL